MTSMKYLPTKDLFQALIDAKRAFGRSSEIIEPVPPTLRSSREDVVPPSLGEEVRCEQD